MSRNCFLPVALFGVLLITACQEQPTTPLRDLIQPLSLEAGVPDTIQVRDIFFAPSYDLTFGTSLGLGVDYDQATGRLVLTPAEGLEGLSLLPFEHEGTMYHAPVHVRIVQDYTFAFRPEKTPERLHLIGSFNDWSRDRTPLTDPEGDGTYEVTLPLEPGRYEYKFVVDGEEVVDPSNPDRVMNPFGAYNSVRTVPPRHPGQRFLHVLGQSEGALTFFYEREEPHEPLTAEHVVALIGNQRLRLEDIRLDGNRVEVGLGRVAQEGEAIVRVAVSEAGQTTNLQTVRFFDGEPRGSGSNQPFIWQDAILYSLMVDRFADGDPTNNQPVDHPELHPKVNYYGGDLQGVLDKLEEGYFTELGVNVLWISPVVQNTYDAHQEYPPPHRYFSAYHGYWPTASRSVDTRFGDMALLKQVTTAAHEQGIRVLLDFVANHVHEDHPDFSAHREWFGQLDLPDGRKNIRFWDEYRLTTWFEPFLPSFDYQGSPEALDVMTDHALWWLKEADLDGFRHDAVKHIPNTFWRMLTRKIKRELPDRVVFQIGETFGSHELVSSYVNHGQLDAQFNFNLYDAALQAFLSPEGSFEALDLEMQKTFSVYGVNHLMANVMDSHDKVRYLAYADGDLTLSTSDQAAELGWTDPPQVDEALSYQKARLYQAYLLTTPGLPTIYYGDEIGMTGAADPDNRRPMRFGEALGPLEQEMRDGVRQLIRLRAEHPALRYGDFLTLRADEQIYAYLRSDVNERVLVVLNKGEEARSIRIDLHAPYESTSAVDLMTGQAYPLDGTSLSIEVPLVGWRVYVVE